MAVAARSARFGALRYPAFRTYCWTSIMSMTADNVEHVISYWIIWELTHNPFWLGFAVIAHWVPIALFSVSFGTVVDRTSRRLLVLVSQFLYITCSITWGVLWMTGQLQTWHIVIILAVHGTASLFFDPSALVIVHDLVDERDLLSGLSLNASLRQVALLVGPIVGGFLMVTVGPALANALNVMFTPGEGIATSPRFAISLGFLVNVFIYLPLCFMIFRLPLTRPKPAARRGGWAAMLEGLRLVRRQPSIVGLMLLTAVPALLIGTALQAIMPAFADRLAGGPGVDPSVRATGYSALLAAPALGAVAGAIGLGLVAPSRVRNRIGLVGTLIWAVLVGLFAASLRLELALVLLLAAGVAQIVSLSVIQTLIQRWAPEQARGRVMGLYLWCQLGMRIGSGLIIGLVATAIGAPLAIGIAATVLAIATAVIGLAIPSLWSE